MFFQTSFVDLLSQFIDFFFVAKEMGDRTASYFIRSIHNQLTHLLVPQLHRQSTVEFYRFHRLETLIQTIDAN